MKNWMHIPLAAAVAAVIGFASTLLATPERTTRGAASGEADLALVLEELRAEQQRLAERLAALPSATPVVAGAQRAPSIDLEQAIAAYMAKQLATGTQGAEARGDAPADPEIAAIADRIVSGEVTGDELERLWQTLREEKRIDGVLAEIELQAELAPNNPDLQSELGKAYIQKLFDDGIGPMAAIWGEKADLAFDRALELDDTHWDARFDKAMALSNWPDFLGKKGESMRQFEILMEQQEQATPEPNHAQTYFFLGNLQAQNGEAEKALATWKRGATRFPDSEVLRRKLEGR